MSQVTAKLTYANVVSTLALFIALTGATAFAAGKVGTKEIRVGAIKSKNIARKAVKPHKIAPRAVKRRHLAANSVGYRQIAPDSVDGSKVINGSLTAADVVGGASVITTASGGPVTVDSTNPNDPDPIPLANAGWVQSPSQTNLFVARLVATVQNAPETACYLKAQVRADGQILGEFEFLAEGSNPTTITEEVMLDGARVGLGAPRPAQITASAHAGNLLNSCATARVDLLQVAVLGIG